MENANYHNATATTSTRCIIKFCQPNEYDSHGTKKLFSLMLIEK